MADQEMMLRTMRMMAWERAKGELMATLHTYHQKNGGGISKEFEYLHQKIWAFVGEIEKDGYLE